MSLAQLAVSDFDEALELADVAASRACRGFSEWPEKVAAGIYSVLDFAVANPGRARILTDDSIDPADCGSGRRHGRTVSHFAGLIRAQAPSELRAVPASSDEALVGGMAFIVAGHLRTGRLERLRGMRPELVLLTLLPYLGFAEAKRWSQWQPRV